MTRGVTFEWNARDIMMLHESPVEEMSDQARVHSQHIQEGVNFAPNREDDQRLDDAA